MIVDALCTTDYYHNVYKGAEVVSDLDTLLIRASDIIRQYVGYKILSNLDNLNIIVQDLVKSAVCAEVEFIDSNGGLDFLNSADNNEVSIGKFSIRGSSDSKSTKTALIAPSALGFLENAGLLYRGLG